MPILAVSAGIVTAVRGEAFIRSPEGDLVPVKVGDSLQAGQAILGANGEVIETAPGDRAAAAAVEVDQAINNLDDPASEEDAPAAGLTIGGSTSLGEGLRVERVSETVSSASFDAATDTSPTPSAPTPGAFTDQRPLGASEPDAQPTTLPNLLVRGVDAVEEGQPVEFIVSLTQPSEGPVSVQLSLLAGSDPVDAAQPGVDTATALQYFNALTQQWEAVTGDLTFATGQTEIRVRVATVDDAEVEGVEYLRLQATVTQGSVDNDNPALPPAGEAPIIDNDKPYLVVVGEPVTEGGHALYTVGLTQASPEDVVVSLALLAGSDPVDAAQPGVDTLGPLEYFNAQTQQWVAVTGDLTLPAGETQLQVRVATVDDAEVEGVEYLRLQATVKQGSVANDDPATPPANDVAIIDNDKPYLVVVGEPVTEGGHALYTVGLTQASPEDVVVSLALLAGSDPVDAAQPGVDTVGPLEYFNAQTQQWVAVTGDLTLPAGETQLQVRVATVDDADVEGVEYLRLQATVKQGSVANDNPALSPAGEAPIIDNDKPYLVVMGEPVTEGGHALYTVGLTQASPEDVVVSLALLAGSDPVDAAQPGVDTVGPLEYFNAQTQQWVAVTGDLTLPAGETQLQVRVATVDDAEVEGVEYLRLQATVKQGSVANDDPATPPANDVAIIDNDKPYLVVRSVDTIEGQQAHYVVQLTSAATETVSVQLAVLAGGTHADRAEPGFDSALNPEVFNTLTGQWDAVTGPLTFQPGETQFEIRVATLDDQAIEPVEYLRLQATVVEGSVANVEQLTWNDLAITDNEGRTITGTADADEVLGQAGDDVLNTLGGDDLLAGGQGNDRLNGGEGADVFAWHLSDVVPGTTSVDRIEAFDVAPHAAGGDVLDLRDLLQGEHTEGSTGNLAHFLHFDTSGSDTRIQISLQGDLNNGAGTINQEIVLEGVNLRTGLGLDAGAADGLVISRMLAEQKLWVDAA